MFSANQLRAICGVRATSCKPSPNSSSACPCNCSFSRSPQGHMHVCLVAIYASYDRACVYNYCLHVRGFDRTTRAHESVLFVTGPCMGVHAPSHALRVLAEAENTARARPRRQSPPTQPARAQNAGDRRDRARHGRAAVGNPCPARQYIYTRASHGAPTPRPSCASWKAPRPQRLGLSSNTTSSRPRA